MWYKNNLFYNGVWAKCILFTKFSREYSELNKKSSEDQLFMLFFSFSPDNKLKCLNIKQTLQTILLQPKKTWTNSLSLLDFILRISNSILISGKTRLNFFIRFFIMSWSLDMFLYMFIDMYWYVCWFDYFYWDNIDV